MPVFIFAVVLLLAVVLLWVFSGVFASAIAAAVVFTSTRRSLFARPDCFLKAVTVTVTETVAHLHR